MLACLAMGWVMVDANERALRAELVSHKARAAMLEERQQISDALARIQHQEMLARIEVEKMTKANSRRQSEEMLARGVDPEGKR
jgi:hypothetical protein